MNVYDFDETLFTGDSEDRFFEFMFKKKGFRRYKLNFDFYELLVKTHIITKTKGREGQYKFLQKIDDLDAVLTEYWNEVEKYMKPWYNEVKRDDDVIASGTPGFLLEPIMKKLGLTGLVATKMDPKTGKIDGDFAIGEFKIVNFKEKYNVEDMDKFYSDAYSDHYLADLAKEAYVIHDDDQCTEWKEYFKAHPDLVK